jgi:hypothetical protein
VQKLKPHKSVEQIAKKHRMDVSDIQKQLDMGEPIEHEHTKDHKLAIDIALQHLDEIPDYYTRLKKMEASAKKEHKKFKDVTEGKGLWANIHARKKAGKPAKKPGEKGYPKTLDIEEGLKQARKNVGASKCWPGKVATKTKIKDGIEVPDCRSIKEETGMVRYCPKCAKEETRDACKYGPKYWDMFSTPVALASNSYDPNKPHPANEEKDHEYSMSRSELSTIISAVKRLKKKMGKGEGNLEAWVQSKITKAADYIDTAADYVDSGEMKSEGVSFNIGSDHRQVQRRAKIHNKTRGNTNSNEVSVAQSKLNEPKWSKPKLEKESVTIQDANGNDFIEFIDLIKPEKIKTFNKFVTEAKKSEMKCNSPKAEPVGDSLTGKSHVVKACEGGKEKLIRFGQRGVKGSPKKEGESKEYASRRNRFKTRHAKNIAKGKMSAAFWANKVKW